MAVTWLEGRLGRLVLPVPASHVTEGRLEPQFVPLPTEQGTATLRGKSCIGRLKCSYWTYPSIYREEGADYGRPHTALAES